MSQTKPKSVIRANTRANQPSAATIGEGGLYHVTDEKTVERSNGSAFSPFAPGPFLDTGGDHLMDLVPNEDFTATRVLNVLLQDADRTIDLGPPTAYNPTWTSSAGTPAIGDGTLDGRWVRHGKLIVFTMRMLCGATTTFGTAGGAFAWGLPANATTPLQLAGFGQITMYDSSVNTWYVGSMLSASASTFNVVTHATAGVVTTAVPFTWAASDAMLARGFFYEA